MESSSPHSSPTSNRSKPSSICFVKLAPKILTNEDLIDPEDRPKIRFTSKNLELQGPKLPSTKHLAHASKLEKSEFIRNLEHNIEESNKRFDRYILRGVCARFGVIKYNHKIDRNIDAEIDTQDYVHRNFVRFLCINKIQMVNFREICILNLKSYDKLINLLLSSKFPYVQNVCFKSNGSLIGSKRYLKDLSKICHKVSDWIIFGNIIFTDKDFRKYLVLFKNTKRVEFIGAILEVNVPLSFKGSLKNSQMEELIFNSRFISFIDWNKTNSLENIVSGFSDEPDIHKKFCSLGVYGYNIRRSDIDAVLKRHNLIRVTSFGYS